MSREGSALLTDALDGVEFTETVSLTIGLDGRLRLNNYVVLGTIGRGAFAEVLLGSRAPRTGDAHDGGGGLGGTDYVVRRACVRA